MRSSRSLRAVVFLALALLAATPAAAGERYSFSTEHADDLTGERRSQGRVVTEGTSYRIEYERSADDHIPGVVSTDGGAHESLLFPERRTYLDVDPTPLAPASHNLLVLAYAAYRLAERSSADDVDMTVTVAAEPEETPDGRVRRHELRLSYRVILRLKQGERIRGRVQVQATYWMAEDRKLLVPPGFVNELRTSFPEIDSRLAKELVLPGVPMRQELTIRSDIDRGAKQFETIKVVLQKIETVPTTPDMFVVPAGFRREDPVSAPGR
jgi:hypothetical protein